MSERGEDWREFGTMGLEEEPADERKPMSQMLETAFMSSLFSMKFEHAHKIVEEFRPSKEFLAELRNDLNRDRLKYTIDIAVEEDKKIDRYGIYFGLLLLPEEDQSETFKEWAKEAYGDIDMDSISLLK